MIETIRYAVRTQPIYTLVVFTLGTIAAIALASMHLPNSFAHSEMHTEYLLSNNLEIRGASVNQWLEANENTRIEPVDDKGGKYRVEELNGSGYVVDVRNVSIGDRMGQPPLFRIERVDSGFHVLMHNPENVGIARTKSRLKELVESIARSS